MDAKKRVRRVSSYGLRVASEKGIAHGAKRRERKSSRTGKCTIKSGFRVAGFSMLDPGYSMQSAGAYSVYLFVGMLESHRKLNYAFTRHRKRWSGATPSFIICHSSFVPPGYGLRVCGWRAI